VPDLIVDPTCGSTRRGSSRSRRTRDSCLNLGASPRACDLPPILTAPAFRSGPGSEGGTWTTTSGGSGTYRVTALVSWKFANFQSEVGFIDNIDEGTKANGVSVLKIAFSDGSTGVLTAGCHGPGAPPGIFEGIATTKGFKTYYAVQPPAPGVDANRTLFHVG
jgi:hypothetical protein